MTVDYGALKIRLLQVFIINLLLLIINDLWFMIYDTHTSFSTIFLISQGLFFAHGIVELTQR